MKRKERREKRSQKRLRHLESKQSNNCNEVCTFPGLKRKEGREKKEEITKRPPEIPKLIENRFFGRLTAGSVDP